jgi:hypothetical protein
MLEYNQPVFVFIEVCRDACFSFLICSPLSAHRGSHSQLRVNHLYNIDSKLNTYVLDAFVRLTWVDERLVFNVGFALVLAYTQSTWRNEIRVDPSLVWKPDIITYNVIDTCAARGSL